MPLARMRMPLWIGALWLLCAPGLASAAAPLGNFAIRFGGNHSIWFGTGEESSAEEAFCEAFAEGFDEVESCEFALRVDGKGKITGHLGLAAWSDGILVTLNGPVKGSQRGDGSTGHARESLSIKLAGEASDGVITLGLKSKLEYTGQIAPGGVASGVWDERFCIQGEGCETLQTRVPMTLLPNGAWLLELAIDHAGGRARIGNARVGFSDGGECFYALKGKYDPKPDRSSLDLTPTPLECGGTSLRLKDARPLGASVLSRSNDALYAFICAGTLSIAASVDPSACAWSPIASPLPLAEVETLAASVTYKLFGYGGTANSPYVGFATGPSFGSSGFVPHDASATISAVSVEADPAALLESYASQSQQAGAFITVVH